MPINYLRYHPDWKDIIRPDALKRAQYRCQFCQVPNRAIIIYDSSGNWLEVDDVIRRSCKVTGQKMVRVILTIAHLNHLVIDNRPDNLRALCQKCHMNHDRKHKNHMIRIGRLARFSEMEKMLGEDGSEKYLPQVFAVYRAKRNQTKQLDSIIARRSGKKYDSKYDKELVKLRDGYKRQADILLKWACEKLSDHYNHPDPMAFYKSYYDSELRLIGDNYSAI